MLVLWIGLMYISSYPVTITLRQSSNEGQVSQLILHTLNYYSSPSLPLPLRSFLKHMISCFDIHSIHKESAFVENRPNAQGKIRAITQSLLFRDISWIYIAFFAICVAESSQVSSIRISWSIYVSIHLDMFLKYLSNFQLTYSLSPPLFTTLNE